MIKLLVTVADGLLINLIAIMLTSLSGCIRALNRISEWFADVYERSSGYTSGLLAYTSVQMNIRAVRGWNRAVPGIYEWFADVYERFADVFELLTDERLADIIEHISRNSMAIKQ
ncbi:hypothetical protein [Sporosarcina cyprini]|uniref:hypothetical protein n=1 Tax=Sporosarcina cyprini TaxID=2910523 RepID=UPI001EDDC6A0|nr:hypothetical protein [Sporosarcina cyprini]MCG3089611.1 hypothetical protein [Sporosarcina cyprini]